MGYPELKDGGRLINLITEYARLKHEYGARGVRGITEETEAMLSAQLRKLMDLEIDGELAAKEPDELQKIKSLRNPAKRRLWTHW